MIFFTISFAPLTSAFFTTDMRKIVAATLLLATTCAQAQDMRERTGNRSAIASGKAFGETSGQIFRGANNQPMVLARLSPAGGRWVAVIDVITLQGDAGNSTTTTRFRPGDGARWSSAADVYYGGINPFAKFQLPASDQTVFGETHASGVAFHAIQLGELLSVVGHAMRVYRTGVGAVAIMDPGGDTGTATRVAAKRVRQLQRSVRPNLNATALSKSFSGNTRWLVAVPESFASTDAMTGSFRVTGCDPLLDQRNLCVARAGVAFVPFTGSLTTFASASGAVNMTSNLIASNSVGNDVHMIGLLGLDAYKTLASVVLSTGQAGAVVTHGTVPSLLSSVSVGEAELPRASEVPTVLAAASATTDVAAVTWLTSPVAMAGAIATIVAAYQNTTLSEPCSGCQPSAPANAGTVLAKGITRAGSPTTAAGATGIVTVEGVQPVRRTIK